MDGTKQSRSMWGIIKHGGNSNMERRIKIGQVYRHFKGCYVKVLGVAKHSETLENYVVYKHLNTNENWIRPEKEFLSEVDHNKYPDITQRFRFEETDGKTFRSNVTGNPNKDMRGKHSTTLFYDESLYDSIKDKDPVQVRAEMLRQRFQCTDMHDVFEKPL